MVEQQNQLAALIAKLEGLVERLEKAQGGNGPVAPVKVAEPQAAATSSGSSSGGVLGSLLKDFDNEVSSKIKPFEDAAAPLGEVVKTIVSK